MSQDTAHAWWSLLRHQGLLLSPVVMPERYPSAPESAQRAATNKLRDAQTRFAAKIAPGGNPGEIRCPAAHNAVGLAGESPAVGIDCLST